MNFLLLLVALGLAGASPLADDKVCQPHSRPWQVRLHGRSGALIDEWWIVTALEFSLTPHETIASLGEHDVTVDEGTEQHIYVSDVIHHSPYRSPFHSLTMLRLAKPARFNQHVQPVPLPDRCPQPGETCHVSGWGSTIPNHSEHDPYLKCITVRVVDDQTCMNTLPEFLFWSAGMVCAGQENTDNCISDNGSVMVCDGQLQGVQWFSHGCSNPTNSSTIYTKLCLYKDWINEVMDNYVPALSTEIPMMTT